ncbi:MAG: HAD family hydrolase [Lachnospiraceae bacterium]|nr:HAD family hydrolase [Lachnospiraceae bacterium]
MREDRERKLQALGEYALFLDLDDTLYDRSEPFKKAFLGRFPEAAELAAAAYWACEKRGNEVFLPSQRGEISMEEMYIYRYQRGLADVQISISPQGALEFQETYREYQREITLASGIPKLLDFGKKYCRTVGVITNGPAEKQRGKLKTLGLERWISDEMILISGEVKIDKPDPAIFQMARDRANTEDRNMIFVGDSYANDICPARELGWKTIFLNRRGKESGENCFEADLVLGQEELLTEEHLLLLMK